MAHDSENDKKDLVKKHLELFPDFPKPGICFLDIFSVLRKPDVFVVLKELLVTAAQEFQSKPDVVVGIEARGFLFGPLLALELQIPFVPVRKRGKLPGKVRSVSYTLEYGTDVLEIQANAIKKNDKVLIVDDLLATGGSSAATCQLLEELDGNTIGCLFVIEVLQLQGRSKLPCPVQCLIGY